MSSTIARATLITPPWHTATTRSPGCAAITLIERPADAGRERLGRLATEALPTALHHVPETGIVRRAELFHRDVVVGLHVVLDESVDDVDDEPVRSGDRLRGLDRAQLRARHDGADRFVREPVGEPLCLLLALGGQMRIRGRTGARCDALRLRVSYEQQVHQRTPPTETGRTAGCAVMRGRTPAPVRARRARRQDRRP